ncbi:androgen-induced gene 1 protein-like [Physella acuta]|uniref:androgen-induced gene 1 protein-like n=1 Tax=Physella acuta TaxID=109671 RepID=UPI0027DB4BAB|nr:androgen-induced gene 1 protein-like [Physella acuta]
MAKLKTRSSSKYLIFGLHVLIFIIDLFSTYYDIFNVDIGQKGFKSKFMFLTVWNICLQTLYFGFCVVSDLAELAALQHKCLRNWRDTFHSTIAFPVGTFVVLLFWGLYSIDRELVYPKALDDIIPSWLNHLLHTTPLPFLITDKYLVYHVHPPRLKGMIKASSIALIYIVWILFIAFYDNIWVYPILKTLSVHGRAVFLIFCMVIFGLLYILGEKTSSAFWKQEPATTNLQKPEVISTHKKYL